jgi:hypothetical protein
LIARESQGARSYDAVWRVAARAGVELTVGRCTMGAPLPPALRAKVEQAVAAHPDATQQYLPRPEDLPPGFDLPQPISVTFIPAGVFEAGPLEVVGLDAPLGGGPLWEQPLEDAPRHPDHAIVLADLDGETLFSNRLINGSARCTTNSVIAATTKCSMWRNLNRETAPMKPASRALHQKNYWK